MEQRAGAARRLETVAVAVARLRGDRARRICLAEEAPGDRPAVAAHTRGQHEPPERPVVLDESAERAGLAARRAPRRDEPARGIGILVQRTVAEPRIDTDAQHVIGPDRRTQLDLAANARGGRVALVERQLGGGRADHAVGEVARLDIGERVDRPGPAMDQPDAGIIGLRTAVGAREAQRASVAIEQAARLDLGRGIKGHDRAQPARPVAIARAHARRGDLAVGRSVVPVAPLELARETDEPTAHVRRDARRHLLRGVAAIKRLAGKQRQVAPRRARQLDRPRDRPRTERARPAAARHPHPAEPIRRNRVERDIAEERIGERHPVEQHQRAARGVAAERAQRHALCRGIGRAAVGAAELLEAGDIEQHVLDPARGVPRQPVARDRHRTISGHAGRDGQGLAQHHDVGAVAWRWRRSLLRKRGEGRCKGEQREERYAIHR